MKVLLIGHSFVRDLKSHIDKHHQRIVNVPNGKNFQLFFSFVPGATFETYLSQPELLDYALQLNPEVIVIILGGNDIKRDVDLSVVKDHCYKFFHWLKLKLPSAYLIGTQIESRFIELGDRYERFGTPHTEEFKKLSVFFNSWLNKQKFKNKLVCIRGPNKLDNKCYYRDSVHLNDLGLTKYFELLKNCLIDYCQSNCHN